MPFLTAGGHRLDYRWVGPAPDREPTLVFLHHGLGSVSTWGDLPDRLAAATECGALVYSRQGYGHSDPVAKRDARYLHDEALVVLPEVLAATGVREPILVGHSDGASIALLYAGLAPDKRRVRAVVSMAAHVIYERLSLASMRKAKQDFAAGKLRAALARHHDDVDGAFRGWANLWDDESLLSWSIVDCLAGIEAPTLVIQGTGDEYGTLRQVDLICAGVKGPVERLVLECGHAPHEEKAEVVLKAIVALVRRALEAPPRRAVGAL
ncbi:MAG TPA: alpha/beta hydrolase [Alphaproteobacteria bacterium]|nr:alpha/beta hydrolase [Alphaproteobacteria bacterium]